MLKNYLKIALRNLLKYKVYSFLNIAGLAIGLACCALIMMYVRDELSYDRFHQNADRIYRVILDAGIGGTFVRTATTPAPMAATLVLEFPEVATATRFWQNQRVLISHGDKRFYEEFNWTDSTVFSVFSLPLVQGDSKTALAQPNTLVISEALAQKYFGNENPLGKVLRYDNRVDYKVTGVMKSIPSQSHFRFDLLGSMLTLPEDESLRWVSNSFYTYILMQPGASPAQLEAKFPALIRKYVAPQIEQALGKSFDEAIAAGAKWEYDLQALPDIYLHSNTQHELGVTSDVKYVYILTAIAVFVLLIACINFMNLATARSANRAKEVGMRKVLGSFRGQLVKQFLSESVLLAFIALVIALAAIDLLLPLFNNLAGKKLVLGGSTNAIFFLGLLGVTLVVGLLAGMYPAFVLSGFQPVAVLKGSLRAGAKNPRLRSALVVAQFAISIILLIGTGVVFQQLEYMRSKRMGFNQEQLVVLPIETRAAQQRYESFRQELRGNPNVVAVAASDVVPGRFEGDDAFRPEGAPQEVAYPLERLRVSHDFLTTLEMEVVTGRGFSRDFVTDTSQAVMINETAARRMGMTAENAVGRRLIEIGVTTEESVARTIIGVVKDFHFESMHREIKPVVIFMQADRLWRISVRIRPENIPATIAFLQEKWQAFEPGYPWRYFFLDEDFGRLFQNEERQAKIFGNFTILAIAIACLGLFGLASFIAEQRTKEIGVRKVLGSSVQGIVLLLSTDFTKLVGIAFLVAAPVAYFVMKHWLQDFAYRTDLHPIIFLLAGLLALLIAWLTVGYQAIKAALTNPVEALRYE
jgi:putative ABC transport system permease protein